MGNVVALDTRLPVRAEPAPAALPPWKTKALHGRLGNLVPALDALREGASDAAVIKVLVSNGLTPATARRRVKALRGCMESGDFTALAPNWKRPRSEQAWHLDAMKLGELPSKPNNGEIAFRLRGMGFDVTVDQVRAYRKSLPSHRAETSQKALGANFYKLNHKPYVIRDFSQVPVGYQYESDGHCCDFYVEHPETGSPFQPELTAWMDVRSQFIVDFWISGFENSFDLRMSLSRALLRWDHVPKEIRVDHGAYKAKVLVDETVGYATRMGIKPHFAIARNARSKMIEGEWKLFSGRFSKFQPTFLHNRTDDMFRAFRAKWDRGQIERLTVKQCYDKIAEYFHQRNNEPREGLGGKTPAEVWSGLQKNPVLVPAAAICRPRIERVVRNWRVRLHKRTYQADLRAYETRSVVVEYDDWHDEQVWLYDQRGNFICCAELVDKQPGVPVSRVEERVATTLEGQQKRLQVKLAENEGRARMPLQLPDNYGSVNAMLQGTALLAFQNSDDLVVPAVSLPAAPALDAESQRFLDELQRETPRAYAPGPRRPISTEDEVESNWLKHLVLAEQIAIGADVSDGDRLWLERYSTTAEYRARREFEAAFNPQKSPLAGGLGTTPNEDSL